MHLLVQKVQQNNAFLVQKVQQAAYHYSHYKAVFMIKLNMGQISLMYVVCEPRGGFFFFFFFFFCFVLFFTKYLLECNICKKKKKKKKKKKHSNK